MLTLTRSDPDTFTLTSDDKNAENAALGEAIDQAAPHLLKQFDETEADDDGQLILSFPREEWSSLLEILDSLDPDDVDPERSMAMADEVDQALHPQ